MRRRGGVLGDAGAEGGEHPGVEALAGAVERGGPHAVVGRDAAHVDLGRRRAARSQSASASPDGVRPSKPE